MHEEDGGGGARVVYGGEKAGEELDLGFAAHPFGFYLF
jgi:hypothetical protein